MIADVIRKYNVEKDDRDAFRRFRAGLIERSPETESMDSEILQALWAFYRLSRPSHGAATEDQDAYFAVRWLSGDRLEREELWRVRLKPSLTDDNLDEVDDEQVMRMLVMLSELPRAASKPFLLCLDQVDVLDDDRMRALATFLHILLDSSRNLLTVFCGVQEMIVHHRNRQTITGADWERICQGEELDLPRLDASGTAKSCKREWRTSSSR